MKKFAIFAAELLAFCTALLAIYEFFVAGKIVPYFKSHDPLSDVSLSVPFSENLASFLAQNDQSLIYLDLNLLEKKQSPDEYYEAGWHLDDGKLVFALPRDSSLEFPDVSFQPSMGFPFLTSHLGTFIQADVVEIDGSAFSILTWQEDMANGVELRGLFFVQAEFKEGSVEMTLRPVGSTSENETIFKCTPAMNGLQFWEVPKQFYSNCL